MFLRALDSLDVKVAAHLVRVLVFFVLHAERVCDRVALCLLKRGALICVSVHHIFLCLLFQSVPLLFQLCNNFLHGNEGSRAVALRLRIRAPIRNTVAQGANAAIYELLHLHRNQNLFLILFKES